MEIVLADDGKAYKAGEEIADSSEESTVACRRYEASDEIQHSLVEVILEIIQEITLIREAMQV